MERIQEVCRCCLKRSPFLQDIFETTIAETLIQCTNTQISASDGNSHFICNECINDLISWFVFKTKFDASNDLQFIIRYQFEVAGLSDSSSDVQNDSSTEQPEKNPPNENRTQKQTDPTSSKRKSVSKPHSRIVHRKKGSTMTTAGAVQLIEGICGDGERRRKRSNRQQGQIKLDDPDMEWRKGKFAWIKFTKSAKYIPGFILASKSGEDEMAQSVTTRGVVSDYKYLFYKAEEIISDKLKSKSYKKALVLFNELTGSDFK